MRNILALISLSLLLTAPAFCVPTAQHEDFGAEREKFLIDKVLNNEPITFCIDVPEAEQEYITLEEAALQLKFAFAIWTEGIADYMHTKGRSAEFKDLIKALEKKVKLEQLGKCNTARIAQRYGVPDNAFFTAVHDNNAPVADLTVTFDTTFATAAQRGDEHKSNAFFSAVPSAHMVVDLSGAPYNLGSMNGFNVSGADPMGYSKAYADAFNKVVQNITELPVPTLRRPRSWQQLANIFAKHPYPFQTTTYLIIHELGHALGLADQYEGGVSNADPLYGTVLPRASVMSSERYLPSCDDVDGIITLNDRVEGNGRYFSSFCNDGIKFKGGKEVFLDKYKERVAVFGKNINITVGLYKESIDNNIYFQEYYIKSLTGAVKSFVVANHLFDFVRYSNIKDENLRFWSNGHYKKIADGSTKPVGEWHSILSTSVAGEYQDIVDVFDDEGKQISSMLHIYEEDTLVVETPRPINVGKSTKKADDKANLINIIKEEQKKK